MTLRPLAFLNGHLVPAEQAAVAVTDAGFVLGTTVSEQLRTFGGRLFRLDEHLDRLRRSLSIVGVELPIAWPELTQAAIDLAAANHARLPAGDDLGLAILVTPGPYASFAMHQGGPALCLHTYPLHFARWAGAYEAGVSLAVSTIRQVPSECWPAELKCRSRMHYYLADREAAARLPGARALLLDQQGNVSETSTANVLLYLAAEGLVSPPRERILPGITLAVVRELAARLTVPFVERSFTPAELAASDEVLLTSTPFGILPVTHCDGQRIGRGSPGPVFGRLLSELNSLAGLDIAAQAREFASRAI